MKECVLRKNKWMKITAIGLVCLFSCVSNKTIIGDTDFKLEVNTVESERDAVFSLAAYVVVYKNWQSADKLKPRGHNIGCILVDKDNKPVAWNINSNGITNDSTQHGEVRLMQDYIKKSGNKYLDGYTIYTTLEPCVMCSGMMSLTKITRTVYGQTDDNYPNGAVGYGRAIERIKLDSRAIGGYPPYPRTPDRSDASSLSFRTALDYNFSHGSETDITAFLTSETARKIYEESTKLFYNYRVKFSQNQAVYDVTLAFINNM
jgi:tRNA(Arg) A34 adenosine deaminase TadA